MKTKRLIVTLLSSFGFLLFWTVTLWRPVQAGGPWYVSPGGDDTNDCSSPVTACKTIAAAIRADNGGGGGIALYSSSQNSSSLMMSNSTLYGNTANEGGGVSNTSGSGGQSQVTFINSTISGNTANKGGGVYNNRVSSGSEATVTLKNSLVAGNHSPENCDNNKGVFTSDGHNLDDDDSCNLSDPTDKPNTDPLLGPFQDNGGSTLTVALLSGSPAIDAADTAACAADPVNNTDQRGESRPQGATCDIGAYEAYRLQVVKSAAPAIAPVGETISYTYRIENISSVDLRNIVAVDDKVGPIPLNRTTLAPGQTAAGELTYTIIEADLPGPLVNTVAVTGTPPSGPPVSANGDASVTLLSSQPAITIAKTAGVETARAGDTVTYTYRVQNISTVVLNSVQASDDPLGPISLDQFALTPGQVTTGALTYTVVEADLPGPLVNTATVTGTPLSGPPVTATDKLSLGLIPVLPDAAVYLPLIVKQ